MADNLPDAEHFSNWVYDPGSLGWFNESMTPEQSIDIGELSGGDFTMRNRFIVSMRTGDIVADIDPERAVTLSVGSMGTIFVHQEVREDDIGMLASPNTLYSLEITAEIPGPKGEESSAKVGRSSLTGFGEGVYVRDYGPGERPHFQSIVLSQRQQVAVERRIGELRAASPRELLERGLIGWLSRNARMEIDQLANEGMELEDGTITTDGSEIVRALAQLIRVTPYLTTRIRRGTQA